jgi:hypothetical protein
MLIYKLISPTPLSISRLHHALSLIVEKHASLRTALIYDNEKLVQQVLPISTNFYDFKTTYIQTNVDVNEILLFEERNQALFDLSQGRVFRCHLLRYSSEVDDDDNLYQNDIILFNFHHITTDGISMLVFINDLRQAFTMQELPSDHEKHITYLDYAHYERLEDWSDAQQYWTDALRTLRSSSTPYNHSMRTGKGLTVSFDVDPDLVTSLFHFVAQTNLTLFQVGLAAFFTFLYKISNSNETDLCTMIIMANRYRYEFENMVGFFVNTVPFRLHIDWKESFAQFCRRIQQHWLEILPYSHLPFQEVVKLYPSLAPTLTRTTFLLQSTTQSGTQNLTLADGVELEKLERHTLLGNIAKFDLTCIFHENRLNRTISVSMNASLDVYDESTIHAMTRRFQCLLRQLFSDSSLFQSSALLSEEREMLRNIDYGDDIFPSIISMHKTISEGKISIVEIDVLQFEPIGSKISEPRLNLSNVFQT